MSITITTGGITMTGAGVTFTASPPSEATAGWFLGGQPGPGGVSTVSRITYATDTATATVRGPLSANAYRAAATGTLDYGWLGGGSTDTSNNVVSRIMRSTYATDTATAVDRGPLSYSAHSPAATGTNTYGWWAGGIIPTPSSFSTVSRITYSTDTNTGTTRGPLTQNFGNFAASTDGTTYGWYAGGVSVNRITFATDTDTASSRGPLSSSASYLAGTGTSTDGWFAGGQPSSKSTVQRINYATDTATASVRGPLTVGRFGLAASTDNSTYGWFSGGYSANAPTGMKSTVNRITFATDTDTASTRGSLGRSTYILSASSGIQ